MHGYFFTSPTSNTDTVNMPTQHTPAASRHTSTAMMRTDSHDSTTSTISSYSASCWDIPSRPGSSAMSIPFPTQQRRTSSSSSNSVACGWFPSPYRSCLSNAVLEDASTSSYLSDDDLLFLPPPTQELPTISNELSTEEQIALLREQADREDAHAPQQHNYRAEAWWSQHRPQLQHQPNYADVKKAKAVRFAPAEARIVTSSGRRRSSATAAAPKKRSPTVRRNLVELGQQ